MAAAATGTKDLRVMLYILLMGFALWIGRELAWAEGRHEYRPMGVAVVARSDLFRQRDFRPKRRAPSPTSESYVGLFASLGHLNGYLKEHRHEMSRKDPGRPQPQPNKAEGSHENRRDTQRKGRLAVQGTQPGRTPQCG
jgi:hypothetical protein